MAASESHLEKENELVGNRFAATVPVACGVMSLQQARLWRIPPPGKEERPGQGTRVGLVITTFGDAVALSLVLSEDSC